MRYFARMSVHERLPPRGGYVDKSNGYEPGVTLLSEEGFQWPVQLVMDPNPDSHNYSTVILKKPEHKGPR